MIVIIHILQVRILNVKEQRAMSEKIRYHFTSIFPSGFLRIKKVCISYQVLYHWEADPTAKVTHPVKTLCSISKGMCSMNEEVQY